MRVYFWLLIFASSVIRAEVSTLGLRSHHLDFSIQVKKGELEINRNGLSKTTALNDCGQKEAKKIMRSLTPNFVKWLGENQKTIKEDNAQLILGDRVLPVHLNKDIDSSWARMPASVDAKVAALEAKCSKEK